MELLPDPANDRFVPTLDPPPNKPLAEDVLYPYKGEYSSHTIEQLLFFAITDTGFSDKFYFRGRQKQARLEVFQRFHGEGGSDKERAGH
jgi:hypothetical protein